MSPIRTPRAKAPRRLLIATAALIAATGAIGSTAPQADAATTRSASSHGMSADVRTVRSAIIASNEEAAFRYFQAKGLTAVQAAGVVGNLDQESGVDPTISQYGGGAGRGIAQWSAGGRWDTYAGDNVTDFAADQGTDRYALQTQLDFIWYELTSYSYYGLGDLQAADTIEDATVAFQDSYEGCGTCETSTRVSYAQTAYDNYA